MLLHPHRAGVRARRELQHAGIIARLRVVAQDRLRQAGDPAHGPIGKGRGIEKLEFRFRHASPLSSTGRSAQLEAMSLISPQLTTRPKLSCSCPSARPQSSIPLQAVQASLSRSALSDGGPDLCYHAADDAAWDGSFRALYVIAKFSL